MREDNPNTRPWRQAVAAEAMIAMGGEFIRGPWLGPLELQAVFMFARPKSHYRSGAHAGELKPGAPEHHATKPDTDKLLRSVGDALTGILVRDDSQFAIVHAWKAYTTGAPCAEITVRTIDQEGT